MADLDENELPVVNVGDKIRLVGGQRGVIRSISKKDEHFGFDRYQIELASGHLLTEPRYRFDVIPSCPGRDPQASSVTVTSQSSVPTPSYSHKDLEINADNNVNESVTPVTKNIPFGHNKPHNPLPLQCDNADTSDPQSDDSLADFDIAGFLDKEVNQNTRKKTDCDVNTVHRYFQNKLKEKRQMETIPPHQLNKLLCVFFINVRNQKGEEYEPSSIRGIQCSIDRYLKAKDYGKQVATSVEFAKVMEVIKCKQKKLKREGKGNQPKRAEAISDTDIDKFYETGQLGTKNPETLLRTVWLLNTVHFGMIGVTEHRDMKWGDVRLCRYTDGHEFVEFNERQTKTRPGSNPKNVRAVPPRAWATPENPTRCPVANYKIYQSRRPPTYCNPDDPYYIATNTNTEKSNKWYKCQPVGVNKLGSFMRIMAENAGLAKKSTDASGTIAVGKRLTNHSARKYLVQKLNDTGLPPNQIVQISGHKNLQSVNNYSTINCSQQGTISRVLSNPSSRSSVTPFTNSSCSSGSLTVTQTAKTDTCFKTTPFLFGGPIYGGTFNVTINNTTAPIAPRKRPRVVYSESDSD